MATLTARLLEVEVKESGDLNRLKNIVNKWIASERKNIQAENIQIVLDPNSRMKWKAIITYSYFSR